MGWLQYLAIAVCLVAVVLAEDEVVRAGKRKQGRARKKKMSQDCGDWSFEGQTCQPREGSCGVGLKLATRPGDWCMVTQKRFPCRVPCPGEPTLAPGEDDLLKPARSRRARQKKKRGNICKYNRKTKECTACDTTTNSTTCTLQLKKGPRECLQTKTLTKRCPGTSRKAWRKSKNKGVGCKYTKGEWSACNTDSNEITRTLTLKKGPSTCEQTKTVTKRCKAAGRQGAAKTACNFGPWSEFGDCQNGVKTKTREVISGGARCQRRAAKTKPCT